MTTKQSLGGVNLTLNTLTREYETFRTQALELAPQLTGDWTDFFPSDPGVVLVELFAGKADILSYYVDRMVGESHWATAQLPQSMFNMAELISYTPPPASSATVDIEVVITSAGTLPGTDSVSSLPIRISNEATLDLEAFDFELLESYTAVGAETVTLTFIEGTSTNQELLGTSTGAANQSFDVAGFPLTSKLDGSPAVTVESPLSTFWTRVDNFQESSSTDNHFTLSIDAAGKGSVVFSDGVNGAIPVTASSIYVSYRTGGGVEANSIGNGTITKVLNDGSGLVASVTNAASPSGGRDVLSVEEIRQLGPQQYATQDRAVTHQDYEALARTIGSVYKAKAAYYDGSPLIEGVYIAVTGSNPIPSGTWNFTKQSGTGLLGEVGKILVSKAASAVRINMLPITALTVDVTIDACLLPTVFAAQVEELIRVETEDYITGVNNIEIPTVLTLSELYCILQDISGVSSLVISKFTRVPYVEEVAVGISDTVFSAVTVQGSTLSETWVICFDSTTTFTVEGGLTGLQSNTGTVGTLYTTDDGELAFTATAGTSPNKVGDRYRIITSSTAGNISIQPTEIPVVGTITITSSGGIT